MATLGGRLGDAGRRDLLVAHDAVVRRARPLGGREVETVGDDVGGMAVHIAAPVAALAESGDVLAAPRTARLSARPCASRTAAPIRLRDVPGRWPLFGVAERRYDSRLA